MNMTLKNRMATAVGTIGLVWGSVVTTLAVAALPPSFAEAATTDKSITYVVSLPLAEAVAETLTIGAIPGKQREASEYSVVTDAKDRPAAYGFNFEGGGWAIISATLDIAPVLAYSDEGFIDLAHLPAGPKEWVDDVRTAVEETRAPEEEADVTVRARVALLRQQATEWVQAVQVVEASHGISAEEISRIHGVLQQRSELGNDASVAPSVCGDNVTGGDDVGCNPPPPRPEPGPPPTACKFDGWTTYGPWLKTQWDQGCAYNTYTPGRDSEPNACARALTGCGPTAAGQVMRYWQRAWGHNYNWSGMYNDNTWSSGRADLLSDIGVAANSNYYADGGTSTKMENLESALNQFGYWTSRIAFTGVPLRSTTASIELRAGRPVILRGDGPGSAHIWVADGFQVPKYSGTNCTVPFNKPYYIYHNWGWGGQGGDQPNGWYSDYFFGKFPHDRYFMTVKPK